MALPSLENRFEILEGSEESLDVKPPNPPWVPLVAGDGSVAALSFYYSDPQSIIPVREVTRPDDHKADPNLETMTYGLFSTCERAMRAGIVKRGIERVFFCTSRSGGVRVLTGYYRIGWYYKSPLIRGYSKRKRKRPLDHYALAAKESKFVSPGFKLGDRVLRIYLKGVRLNTGFRTFKYIGSRTAERLLRLLQDTPDASAQHLSEIQRLEKLNMETSGYAYPVRRMKSGFSWDLAPTYLGL